MISTKSRYGLLFLVDLVENSGRGPVDLAGAAGRRSIPEAYLAKLVAPLKSAGIITTSRGARGGYELARKPESVNMLEIVEALEGRSSLIGIELDEEAGGVWKGLDHAVRLYLAGVSLAAAASFKGIDYII